MAALGSANVPPSLVIIALSRLRLGAAAHFLTARCTWD